MDQDQIEIITVNDRNSAEIENPAGAAVGEAFNAHEGSEEADSGSQPQNLNHTSDAQAVLSDVIEINITEVSIETLARVKGLEPTKINLWKVAFEDYTERHRVAQNRVYKIEEEMRSVKNEIYQVVGFFSAFQGLLITAAAQSILLRCNNVGFHVALSAFATAVAVFGIRQKITAMELMRAIIIHHQGEMRVLYGWLSYLKEFGIDFSFDYLDKRHDRITHFDRRHGAFPRLKEILDSYATWLLVSVIAFGGLCMVAMCQIVCNPGHSLPSN